MAEVLSQQEIDQLLSGIKSGETRTPSTHEKEAIPFDFRLPNRISKNQLRTIRTIHENFGESFSSFLVSKLQTIVNINVISVDQLYYSEYVLSVSNPACLYTFNIKKTDIKGIIEVSPELAMVLVDRLLGGNGSSSKQSKIITPIEQKVISVVAERAMHDLHKAWQIVDDYTFEVERFEPDIDFAQITSQSESVLLISFELFINDQSYMMNLCFATFAFDEILSKLSYQSLNLVRPAKSDKRAQTKMLISNQLKKALIDVRVEFGTASITINDLIELKNGDIIKLDMRLDDEHTIFIAEKPLFCGKLGVAGKKKAVKVTRKYETTEE